MGWEKRDKRVAENGKNNSGRRRVAMRVEERICLNVFKWSRKSRGIKRVIGVGRR